MAAASHRRAREHRAATPAGPGMQKVVTDKASFVLYVPKGWKVQEAAEGQAIQVIASDPSGRSSVFFSTGAAPQGENAAALAKREAAKLGRTAQDLEIRSAFASRDGSSLVFDGSYSPPEAGENRVPFVGVPAGGPIRLCPHRGAGRPAHCDEAHASHRPVQHPRHEGRRRPRGRGGPCPRCRWFPTA